MLITPEELLKAVHVFDLRPAEPPPDVPSIAAADPSITPPELAKVMLSLWRCFCDPLRGFLYISVPITSGRREVRLLNRLNCTRTELRTRHKRYRYELIIRPNEADAKRFGRSIKPLLRAWPAINPAAISVADWGQEDYMDLWLPAIVCYVTAMVVTPGWAFSGGSRLEVNLALQLGAPIFDHLARLLSVKDLELQDAWARQTLRREGWSNAQIDDYLPPITFQQRPFVSLMERPEAGWPYHPDPAAFV
ncbi:DUF4406 domain-containing protein [Candidatus Parcubacteria bacterium]|nr:DUF4406 domain-containing protein [Candidatus Parcubacteria bacterium]